MTAERSRRVLLFTPGLHEIGGAARRSLLFAEGLAARGWEVRVITRSATDFAFRLHRRPGIIAVEVPGFRRRRLGGFLYLVVALPLGLAWGRAARGFMAVQLTSPALCAGVCSLLWQRPFVAFTSTTSELSEVNAIARAWSSRIRRRLLRRARYLVAQTPEAALELRELTTRDHIEVLPTPTRVGSPAPLNGEPRVAYVGRLSREKDLGTLLDAWRIVLASVPGATLTLIGEGDAYRSVEDELRAKVASDARLVTSVSFTGWVDDPSSYLCESDVFVLPSVSEGMSNALLEACGAGRVVVVSAIPGNRGVVGPDYPFQFPVADAEALAEMLCLALTDDGARSAALTHIASRMKLFDLDTVVERLLLLLGATAGKSTARQHVA